MTRPRPRHNASLSSSAAAEWRTNEDFTAASLEKFSRDLNLYLNTSKLYIRCRQKCLVENFYEA